MAQSTKYRQGDRVQVRVDSPEHHFRTPTYVQGKIGTVLALWGTFPNPESLAHGGNGLPEKHLYLVEFDQTELWDRYHGSKNDKLLVDIYEHWLNPASPP